MLMYMVKENLSLIFFINQSRNILHSEEIFTKNEILYMNDTFIPGKWLNMECHSRACEKRRV